MSNNGGGTAPSDTRKNKVAPTIRWFIRYCIRGARKRRAEKQKEGAQDRSARKVAAATVAIAIFTCVLAGISAYQGYVSNGQLQEMTNQRLATIAQIRADMRSGDFITKPEITGATLTGFSITPRWKNGGSTNAKHVRSRWGWGIAFGKFTEGVDQTVAALKKNCPANPDVGNAQESTVEGDAFYLQLASTIPVKDLVAATGSNARLVLYGRLQYNDIFDGTPLHFINWCFWLVPNDIPANKVSFITLSYQTD